MQRPRPERWRFRKWLRPLSVVYAGIMRRRNARYARPEAVTRVSVPIISVGNLTVGGTGKTPTVIEVVKRLLELECKPAILTRGYGAAKGETADEVQEFYAAVPDAAVVVNPDRVAGAQTAIGQHGADVLVLDDGFQHRRLGRNLDIVLVDALDPWGGGDVLPAGRLREPREGLQRAGLIVISRANQVEPGVVAEVEQVCGVLAPETPAIRSHVEPVALVARDGVDVPLDWLREQRVQPVSGIGNPRTFTRLLRPLCRAVRHEIAFGDHHRYAAGEARTVALAARQRGVDAVVTTRKDWGKLAAVWPDEADLPPLMRLDVEMGFDDPQGDLNAALAALGAPKEAST